MSTLTGPADANAARLDRAAEGHVRELLQAQASMREDMKQADSAAERLSIRRDYWTAHDIRIDRNTKTAYLATWNTETDGLWFQRLNDRTAGVRIGPLDAALNERIVVRPDGSRQRILDTSYGNRFQRLDQVVTTVVAGGDVTSSTSRLRSQYQSVDGRWMKEAWQKMGGDAEAPGVDVDGHVATYGSQHPTRIILHTTEGSDAAGTSDIKRVFDFWRSQGRGIGAHLIVDGDGHSGKGANWGQITAGVAGANTGSIHIEQIGFAKWGTAAWMRRPAQLNEVAQWLAHLGQRLDIPLVHDDDAKDPRSGVAGHYQFTTSTHWDPGPGYPWDYVMKMARWYQQVGV